MVCHVKSPYRIVVPGHLPYGPWHPRPDDCKRLRPSVGFLDDNSSLDLVVDRDCIVGGNLFMAPISGVSLQL